MGAYSVLLLIAMGITYGWQPDDRGGVEYLIQIPPDQLDQLRHWGEITSAIDPAVQGHVSRIIIRVGNEPLPRITPPDLIGAADRVAMPAPGLTNAEPTALAAGVERGVNQPSRPEASASRVVVMKPDPNDGTPGFSLPSQYAGSAAAIGGSGRSMDAAGREIDTRLSTGVPVGDSLQSAGTSQTLRIPPPATRTPALSSSAPQLAGSGASEMATTRVGGPSTDPTNTRDTLWGTPDGGPSTTAVGSLGGTAANPWADRQSSGAAGSNSPSVNGLTPRDTFGRTPSGLSLPDANHPRTTNPLLSTENYSQLDRQIGTADPAGSFSGRATTNGPTNTAASAQPSQNPFVNASNTGAGQFGQLSSQTIDTASRSNVGQSTQQAWSVDAYGRPLDREGNLLTTSSQSAPVYNAQPPSSPSSQPVYNSQVPSGRASTGLDDGSRSGFQAQPSETGMPPSRAMYAEIDPRFIGRSGSFDAETTDELGESGTSRRFTTQPFFNLLLLLSFVVNVYLFLWLKNLRLQFHELVAAKRLTKSGAGSSSATN